MEPGGTGYPVEIFSFALPRVWIRTQELSWTLVCLVRYGVSVRGIISRGKCGNNF